MSTAITNMTRIEDGPVATVYSGHHNGVPVALKVFPKRFDKRTMSAFTKEQTRLATVRRVTSILMVDGVEELPSGEPALRMELCTQSLSGLVEKVGPLAAQDVIVLGRAVALALAAAHSAGVVHGGIAPNNVLFRNTGEPVVGDFGVTLRQAFTRDPLHAIEYLPPETLRMGTLNESTDLYGLGAVLHFALSARSPHPGRLGEQPGERVLRILGEPVPAINRPDVPIGLSTLVARLLSTTPDRRPQEAAQVAEQLTNMLPNPPKPAIPEDWDDFDTAAPPPPVRTSTAPRRAAAEEDQDFDDFAPAPAHRPARPFPTAHNAAPNVPHRGHARPFPSHQTPPPPVCYAPQARPPMAPPPGPLAPPTQELNIPRPPGTPGGMPPQGTSAQGPRPQGPMAPSATPPPQGVSVPGPAAPVPSRQEPDTTNLAQATPPGNAVVAPVPQRQAPDGAGLGQTTPPPEASVVEAGAVPVPPRQEPSAADPAPAAPPEPAPSTVPGQELATTDLGPAAPLKTIAAETEAAPAPPRQEPSAAGLASVAPPEANVVEAGAAPVPPRHEPSATNRAPVAPPEVNAVPVVPEQDLGAASLGLSTAQSEAGAVSVPPQQESSTADGGPLASPEVVPVVSGPESASTDLDPVPPRDAAAAETDAALMPSRQEPNATHLASVAPREVAAAVPDVVPVVPEHVSGAPDLGPVALPEAPSLLPLAALTPAPPDGVLRPDSAPTEAFAAPPTVEFGPRHQPGVVLERRPHDFDDDGFSDFADAGRGSANAKVLAGPLAPPGQAPKRLVRYDLLAGAALLLALLALVPLLLLRGDPEELSSTPRLPDSGRTAADVQVELAEPVDLTDKVQLSWTASRDFDFAVFVAVEGEKKPKVFLAERNHSMTVDVEPGVKYCFMVHATDGDKVYESDFVGLRGASCRK